MRAADSRSGSLVLWWALRRRQRQLKKRRKASSDIRVSIWSWQLFWGQFKAFWLRLFRRKKSPADAALATELAEPLPTLAVKQERGGIQEDQRQVGEEVAPLGEQLLFELVLHAAGRATARGSGMCCRPLPGQRCLGCR